MFLKKNKYIDCYQLNTLIDFFGKEWILNQYRDAFSGHLDEEEALSSIYTWYVEVEIGTGGVSFVSTKYKFVPGDLEPTGLVQHRTYSFEDSYELLGKEFKKYAEKLIKTTIKHYKKLP